jgi:hypothetical protein
MDSLPGLLLVSVDFSGNLLVFGSYFVCRKGLPKVIASNSENSRDYVPNKANGVYDVANLVFSLLPSKDGAVLRRLLMTAVSAYVLEPFPPFKCKFTDHNFINVIPCLGYYKIFCERYYHILSSAI